MATTTTKSAPTTMATTTTTVLDTTHHPAAVVETFDSLFDAIGLDDRLRQAIKVQVLPGRFHHPTLVQSKALPLAISSGRDLLVKSRTGSGKVCIYIVRRLSQISSVLVLLYYMTCKSNLTTNNNKQQQLSPCSFFIYK